MFGRSLEVEKRKISGNVSNTHKVCRPLLILRKIELPGSKKRKLCRDFFHSSSEDFFDIK
jgi:hypothetical protein